MKEYIKPTTIQVAIRIQHQLLSGSNSVNTVTGLDDVTKGNGDFDPETMEVQSRRRSVWDD